MIYRDNLAISNVNLEGVESLLEKTTERIFLGNLSLADVRNKVLNLKSKELGLKENATQLQEANVEGALNLTREAGLRSQQAQNAAEGTQATVTDSERQFRRTESLVNRTANQFGEGQEDNDNTLVQLGERLKKLETEIPALNEMVRQ